LNKEEVQLLSGSPPLLAQELGVTVDYLVSGKESVITDTIPVIKADKRLNLKAKKRLLRWWRNFELSVKRPEQSLSVLGSTYRCR